MQSFVWLEPWEPVVVGKPLVDELRRELSPQHILYRLRVDAIGRRRDNDDVLFHVLEEPARLAVIHLTWRRNEEPDPHFPPTMIYDDLQDWINRCMIPDHEAWRG